MIDGNKGRGWIQVEDVQIIQSKLIPPVPQASYMRLPNLNKLMNKTQNYRLTIIQGGPGYGKSLCLAQFMKDNQSLYSWYTVTSEDDNIIPFVTYLLKSIDRVYPSFYDSFRNVKMPINLLNEDDLERWIALFINKLLEIPTAFSIVIDDFHYVAHEFQINKLMERIVELLPPHIRLIISTRIRPRWSNLLKMKMKDHMFEIIERDFLFSKEETVVYLEDNYNLTLTHEEIDDVYNFTEGWPIVVNLIAFQLQEKGLLQSTKKPVLKNLFDYLSEEVFQHLNDTERKWLLKFSIFSTFSRQLIEDFYNDEAVRHLHLLVNNYSFIQKLAGDDTFRYHSLFKRFLRNKWKEIDEEQYINLNKKASKYYSLQQHYIEATYHATETDDDSFIGNVLIKTANPLIRSGQFDWFLDIYKNLSEDVINENYLLYYYAGEVHRYRAFYEQAGKAYISCLKYAKKHQNAYLLSRTYAGIAHIFLDTIQPALAEKYLKKSIDWSQKTTVMSTDEKLLLKRQFAENLVNLGRAADAKLWVKKESLPEKVLRRGNLDARIYLRMGRLREAETTLIEETSRASVPDSHRETQVLLSFIYSLTGEVDLALKNAKEGIEIGKQVNSGFIRAVGYTRAGHAEMLDNSYHLEQAEQYYKKGINLMKQLNVPRGLVEPTMGLAILQARKGNFTDAIENSKIAYREAEIVNDQWMTALVLVSMAMIYFYQKKYSKAESKALKARELFSVGGDHFGLVICNFWLSMVYEKCDNMEKLATHFCEFIRIFQKGNFVFYLQKDTFFGPFDREAVYPLIRRVSEFNKSIEQYKIIQDMTKKVDVHPGYHIYVSIFDSVTVYMGTNLQAPLSWQREKSKEMLLYFLLHANRLLSKEEIILALWPNSDPNDDRNFKVTLNHLLKVIEPNRKVRQQSFFIERRQKMYRLSKFAVVNSDMNVFEQYVEKGFTTQNEAQSLATLLKANSVYKSVPFEDYRHIDWLVPTKERLEHKYMRMLEKIAQHYVKLEAYDVAIDWCERLITLDNTWEEAYRLVMIAYYELQNRPQSIKWFEKCKTILHEELNIEPMEATINLYEMIVNEEVLS